jgi:pyruvate dehydrogenase E2 component (dihydrolipoamide acetyltransferase)
MARSQRRRLAVASWRPSVDGRIYTREEIDAAPLLEYAERLTAEAGVRVTVTHIVGRAVALALRDVPEFNARVLFGRARPKRTVEVSFAVDVSAGDDLAPAKLTDVDTRPTAEIAAELAGRTARLRAGEDGDFRRSNAWVRVAPWFLLRPALAAASLWNGGLGRAAFGQPGFPLGAAFVSNIGSLGLDEGLIAPLPMARCALYVCLGAVRDRPVVVDGRVVVRPVMVLTATADHRLVDGAHGARLAAYLRAALADPARLDKP